MLEQWLTVAPRADGAAEDDIGPESLATTTKLVHAIIREEAAALGDAKRVLLGGISQGSVAALHCERHAVGRGRLGRQQQRRGRGR